ncbi:hypothetical protein B7463_g7313, partial [Scytalidium lignicola]
MKKLNDIDLKLITPWKDILDDVGEDVASVYGRDEELKTEILQFACGIQGRDKAPFWLFRWLRALYQEYQEKGVDIFVKIAVICGHAALEELPKESHDRLVLLRHLQPILMNLADLSREKRDFDDAVEVAKELWAKLPDDLNGVVWGSRRWEALKSLADALSERYLEFRERSDLDEALQLAQTVEDLTDDPKCRASILPILAQLHECLYQRTGILSDIDNAIEITEKIVQLFSGANHDRDRARVLSSLSRRVRHRSMYTNAESDVKDAIEHARTAIELSKESEDVQAYCLSSLSAALTNQYDRIGGERVICEAMDKAQDALDLPGQRGQRTRAIWLNNLAAAYLSRYRREQDISDVDHAIELTKEAVDFSGKWNSQRLASLNLLLAALTKSFERRRTKETFEEATQLLQDIAFASHGDGICGFKDLNLGYLLLCQYEVSGSNEDLDKAIEATRRAITLIPASNPSYASAKSNLGSEMMHLHERTKIGADLDDGIKAFQQAVSLTPDIYIEKVYRLRNLARALEKRHLNAPPGMKNAADVNEALHLFIKASQSLHGLPLDRIECARSAISIYVNSKLWEEARSLAEKMLKLVPLACRRYTSRKDQQNAINQISGIASIAASLSLRVGEAEKALQQLEFGRGLILGYIIDDRGNLSVLRRDYKDLVSNYTSLRYQVDADEIEDYRRAELPVGLTEYWSSGIPGQLAREWREVIARELAKNRREALGEIEELASKIRQLPGFERFQMSLDIGELKMLASEGPILVVNISDISADAIILTPHEIKALHLPEQLLKKAPQFATHISTRTVAVATNRKITVDDKKPRGDLYSWLWRNCVKLVLDELDVMGFQGSERPRVWWIGSGFASSLPFHAAGVDFGPTSLENTLSRVVPSYTPTIKALAHSRSRASIPVKADANENKVNSVLLVAMPTTVGHQHLPGVDDEKTAIQRACRGVYDVKELRLPSAENVLEELEQSTIAHFACHAVSDPIDPYESHLLLHKEVNGTASVDKLTMLEVSKLAAEERLWIAFLSACSTAQVKASRLVDEGLHLASAFQMAGFVHVVGTLWPAVDGACARIAEEFYTELAKRSNRKLTQNIVAEALREAVIRLRSEPNVDHSCWAPFVHFGA